MTTKTKPIMFRVGRYYQYVSGEKMHILVHCYTEIWGWTCIAERNDGAIIPIDTNKTTNWTEIDPEDFLQNEQSS